MNSGAGTLADYEVDSKIFHCGIENFFERGLQAMNFVEEKEIAFVERSENAGEIALFLQQRAGAYFDCDAHFVRENLRQRGLAQTWRAIQQDVIESLAASARCFNGDGEIFFYACLANVIVEALWANAGFEASVFVEGASRYQAMACVAQFHLLLTLPRNRRDASRVQ